LNQLAFINISRKCVRQIACDTAGFPIMIMDSAGIAHGSFDIRIHCEYSPDMQGALDEHLAHQGGENTFIERDNLMAIWGSIT